MDLKTIGECIRSLDKLLIWLFALLNMYTSLLALLLLPPDIKLQQYCALGKGRGNTGSPEILQLRYPKITSDILIFTTLLLTLDILMFLVHLQNISSYGNTLNKLQFRGSCISVIFRCTEEAASCGQHQTLFNLSEHLNVFFLLPVAVNNVRRSSIWPVAMNRRRLF